MNAKEINRDSGRILGSLLLPSWAVRSQEDQEDYGVDFEVELMTPDDKATGVIFKAQLKGTTLANVNDSDQLVFSGASVERFSYYLSKLQIPLIFMVCDVAAGTCYWSKVQGNRRLEKDHGDALAKKQESFTIKIPMSQKLEKTPESAERVVDAVEDSANVITLRGLQGLPPDAVREHFQNEPDLEKAEKQLRFFAGLIAIESIRQLFLDGEIDSACAKSRNLLESLTETPQIRILSGWNLAYGLNLLLRRQRVPGAGFEAAKYKVGISSRMLEISRSRDCETRLKRYTCIFARAARMQINGRSAMALVTSEAIQARHGSTMAGPFTRIQRMEISALVARDFFKLRNSLFRLGRDGFYSVMPYALSEVAESLFPFVGALRILEKNDLADAYAEALFDFLPFCLYVVRRFENMQETEQILTSLGLRLIGLGNVSEVNSIPALLRRFEKELDGHPLCKDGVIDVLRKQFENIGKDRKEVASPTMAELRRYFADRAVELGINLDDPNDDLAQIVRIGLEDLDPTRVSKTCQHIHVMTTSHGLPAEMLGLPTAGSKQVFCLRHGHGVESLMLDTAFETFKQQFPWEEHGIRCDDCSDCVPHPEGWQWSYEWEAKQHERYRERGQKEQSDEELNNQID